MPKTSSLAIASRDPGPSCAAVPLEVVERSIYVFRGKRVILDTDAAKIFEVPVHRLHDAVKRNPSRFPADFMFQLSAAETAALLVDSALPQVGRGGRYLLPLAFTELGVAMLTSVLRSDRAAKVSIAVIREAAGRTPAAILGFPCSTPSKSRLRRPSTCIFRSATASISRL